MQYRRSAWWPHRGFEERLGPELLGHWRRAQRHADAGCFAEAEDELESLLAADPDFVPGLSKFGAVLVGQGRTQAARRYLDAALERDPNYPPALSNKGNLLLAEGDLEGALYRTALEVDEAYAVARHNMAIALKRRGDVAGFVRELKCARRQVARQKIEEARRRVKRPGCMTGVLVGLLILGIGIWL